MKLAIIIPAYNEAGAIAQVLESLPKKIERIDEIIDIVVDDGSLDQTFEIAKTRTKHVARHLVNLGVGAATTTGYEAAKKLNCDIAVTIDADGQHNPANIVQLIKPILENKADIVIGTRMLNTKGMPPIKVFGNWAMNVLTAIVFHKWSSDTQSGMRALNKKALSKLKLHSVGYEVCSEIIGEAKRNKLHLTEVPIETIYSDYSKAKGQNIMNAVNILTKIITIKLSGKK